MILGIFLLNIKSRSCFLFLLRPYLMYSSKLYFCRNHDPSVRAASFRITAACQWVVGSFPGTSRVHRLCCGHSVFSQVLVSAVPCVSQNSAWWALSGGKALPVVASLTDCGGNTSTNQTYEREVP